MRALNIHNQIINPWTNKEIEALYQVKGLTKEEILIVFPNRTWKAIHEKAKSLKIRKLTKRIPWDTGLTKETDVRIKNYGIKISKSRIPENPNFVLAVERMRKTILNQYKNGRKSWNDGLTAETDIRVRNYVNNSKTTLRKHILDGSINLTSNSFKGAYFRKDLDRYFRSRWEANFARILNHYNLEWEYESKRCRFNTPYGILILDFYIPKFDLYIEIKGYLRNECREKLNWISNETKINIKVIDGEVYNGISKMYSTKICNWEGVVICQLARNVV